MRIRTAISSLALGLALVTAACGGDDGGGSDYDTMREAVTAVVRTGCEHFIECELLGETTVDQCVTAGVNGTCSTEGVDCDGAVPSEITDAEIAACIDAVEAAECTTATLPPACASISGM